MKKYKYIGKDNPFITKGQIITGEVSTWSECVNHLTGERRTVKYIYLDGKGFNGESIKLNLENFEEIN